MVIVVSIPDICLLPYFLYSHKKYRILCYPLRSNSGWLPIRCAYFIKNGSTALSASGKEEYVSGEAFFGAAARRGHRFHTRPKNISLGSNS